MKFRYSTLMDAYKCYRLFKLKHIDGLTEQIKSADMEFGTIMHFTIANILNPDDADLQMDSETVFEHAWAALEKEDMQYSRYSHSLLMDRGKELLRKFQKQHIKEFKPFKIEERFEFAIDGIEFSCKPDFVGEHNGKKAIVDFKTAGYAYPNTKKIQSDEQMALYAMGVKAAYGYDVEKIVYKILCKDQTCRVQTQEMLVDKKWLDGMCANAVMLAKDLRDRKDFPMNRWSCQSCPMFNVCYGGDDEK